jgi:murein DD-endopeptidase MepM/ murein hydrolase activator NlpD
MAEPAPTRRSSRTSAQPAQATPETLGASRSELRRRAAESASSSPAVVWSRPSEPKHKEATASAVDTRSMSAEDASSAPLQPLTDLPAVSLTDLAAPPLTDLPAVPLTRRARRAPRVETVLAPAEPFELLEPDVDRPVHEDGESVADPEPAASPTVDEFELAARLFSFTGETPIQRATVADSASASSASADSSSADEPARPRTAPHAPRVRRGAAAKRLTAASFSVGVMGIVGLMTVGMTTPAEAVAAASGVDLAQSVVATGDIRMTEVEADEIQAYVAPAGLAADTLDRTESYGTTTVAELASEAGIRNFSNLFVNDPNSAIQWPFAVGVTMSYGYGMRSGRMHEGIDFTPGAGAPIQAIADGTVRVASEAGGAYGVHVIIDHMIDGQLVSSHYAHMEYGSLQVSAGQQVGVGTLLGRTGNTGRSYGAHTHFEILMNGTTAIDPMPWLREHAGG